MKNIYTLYNPTMPRIYEPVIEGSYKVTVDTRFVPIVKQEDDKIHRACSTSTSMGAGEPETLKEVMTMPNGHLWGVSAIYEVGSVLSRKSWIPKNISVVKVKGRKTVPVK